MDVRMLAFAAVVALAALQAPAVADLTPHQVADLQEIQALATEIQAIATGLLGEPELEPQLVPTVQSIVADAQQVHQLASDVLAGG
jgi:hypothetical protein